MKIVKTISILLAVALCLCLVSCGTPTGDTPAGGNTDHDAIPTDDLFVPDNLGDNNFAANDEYELVWHDEFSGDKLSDDWGYEIGFIRNNEPQFYTDRPENVFLQDGVLTIRCIKEEYEGAHYTSGSINTHGTQSFKYGAIEMRAKLPEAENNPKATWPAFWMMGDEGWWPNSGETDILEMYGQHFDKYEANVHWEDENGEYDDLWIQDDGVPTYYGRENLGNDYHTYGIDWDEKQMRFYCDNETLGCVDITDEDKSELHYANYLLLNLAMQPEIIDQAPDSDFPVDYQIDYVRVYQKKK